MIETKFKQTEIGLIPEDWGIAKLGKLGSFSKGAGISREEAHSGILSAIRYGEIYTSYNDYIREFLSGISEEVALTSKRIKCGDLLFAASGETKEEIGKCVAFISNEEAYAGGDIIILSIDTDLHDARFFGYYLNSSQIVKQKAARGQGDAVVHIVPRELATIEIAIPSKQEQQRIAKALSNIDQLISSLSKTIEKKRLIKQGAMQQLLTGKKRLPGFDGEWAESELGTVVNIQRGNMLRSSEYQFGSIPVIAGGITPAGFHNIANRNGRTITISASGANAGYISYYKEPIFATDCSTISEGNDYFIDFIYYVLLLKQNDIFRLQTGGAQPHIHPKDIAPLKINIPCLYEEQVAIANVFTTMDNEIESLEDERDKYIRLKEGMMQKLLTGQIRLVEAETKQQDLPKAKAANVYFKRSVLAAEIADRLCDEPTFGHVKMEKLIFLTEHLCHIDIDSHYHRDAAGPYDNRALRSIDSQMKKQKWFEAKKEDKGYRYIPMQNRGGHKKYFEKYYADSMPMFEKIIDTFKSSTTEQCEIVATLYSAWNDLLQSKESFTDDDILNEVLNNWHESKKRISRNRWQAALDWMRSVGFLPQI